MKHSSINKTETIKNSSKDSKIFNKNSLEVASKKKDFYSLKDDVLFKKVFLGNKNLLKNFLAVNLAIDEKSIKYLEYLNAEMPPVFAEKKLCKLDLLLKLNDSLINVEIQCWKTKFIEERAITYWARLFSPNIKAGNDYSTATKTIVMFFLDYKMFNDNFEIHHGQLRYDETNKIMSDRQQYYFFELPKICKSQAVENDVKLWAQLLCAKSREELQMFKDCGNEAVAEAADEVKYFNEERSKMYREIFAELHEIDANTERQIGFREGVEQGKEEQKNQIKEKLLSMNMSQEQIDQILN